MTDEADMSFVDTGLFNGFPKPSAEVNCGSLVMILYDRMFSSYVRRLASKTMVVEKSYECREDALLSSLLGKSVQHVHRYAAFLQTIEFGYDLCSIYADRFKEFPLCGSIDELFVERIEGIFREVFNEQVDGNTEHRVFFITDQVVLRAIDLVSGLLQQMKILMDDGNAPI
ncbi:unnamed protein product, partial [Rotaria sordida]